MHKCRTDVDRVSHFSLLGVAVCSPLLLATDRGGKSTRILSLSRSIDTCVKKSLVKVVLPQLLYSKNKQTNKKTENRF